MPNGSLVIYDVTTKDSGRYTCIAGNSCNIKHREAFLYVVGKRAFTSPKDHLSLRAKAEHLTFQWGWELNGSPCSRTKDSWI